jgi:hypothetical protein
MRGLRVPLLAAALLFAAAASLAAAPRVEIAITGQLVEMTLVETTPAVALAQLAAAAGFSLEGADALPQTPISTRLKGPLERVIAALTDPVSRVASYAAAEPAHLTRLVLLGGAGAPQLAARSAEMEDPLPSDAAVGASRAGSAALRHQLRTTLGLRLP